MRPRLLHPLRERDARRPGRRRPHDRRTPQHGRPAAGANPAPRATEAPRNVPGGCDLLAERVRQAGGPIDTALYTCGCGYLFSAAVSTTVACPHCGTDQAW